MARRRRAIFICKILLYHYQMDFLDITIKFILEDPIGLLVNVLFGIMLLPALSDTQKPPILTSFSTGVLLII